MELSMKAKKTFLVVILCVMGLSSFAGEIFWTGAGLGFIKANSIRFFPGKGTSWVHSPDYDFVIPADTKNIFWAGSGLGIVKNNTVQFFFGKGTSWVHMPDYDFVS